MAINFPNTPSNGDTHAVGEMIFTYDAVKNSWTPLSAASGASVIVSDTPPVSPNAGDMWTDSETMKLNVYYVDSDSSQWVEVSGSATSSGSSSGSGVTMETTDPLITNNGTLGELWLNTTSGELYACTDITTDDNIWTNIGDGTGNITSNVPPENPTNTTIADRSHESSFNHTFTGGTDTDGTVTHYIVDEISGVASGNVVANPMTVALPEVPVDVPHQFTIPTLTEDTTISFRVRSKDNSGSYSSGVTVTFVSNPAELPSEIEYLVVAGGGGGGGWAGGGGGAGGLLTSTGYSVTTATPIVVTVGAGGSGMPAEQTPTLPTNGSNSSIGSITAIGGGSGGDWTGLGIDGASGGSGGGGPSGGGYGTQPGSGTAGQGNSGGVGYGSGSYAGGGGGGVTTVGANANTGSGGGGGSGLSSSISGDSVTYGGGGGGGSVASMLGGIGGNGGGGNGGGDGTIHTGGGGGGAISATNSGNSHQGGGDGGSGSVIIRYTDTNGLATSATGSPTITTAGGYHVYEWNSSGTITF